MTGSRRFPKGMIVHKSMSEVQFLSAKDRPRVPLPSEVELKFSEKAVAELEEIKTHYPDLKSCVLPGLGLRSANMAGASQEKRLPKSLCV